MTEKAERKINIQKLIKATVKEAIQEALAVGEKKAKEEVKDPFRKTEARVSACKVLKENIVEYHKDIEDLQREEPGRSKDIVMFCTGGGGIKKSAEEIQEARIEILKMKIKRDQEEVDTIERALDTVRNDKYYPIIEMRYFQEMSDDEIGEELSCDASTVRRQKNRIIRKVSIKLYGAQAVG